MKIERLLATLVLPVIGLYGCGGGSDDSSDTGPGTVAAPGSTAGGGPAAGGSDFPRTVAVGTLGPIGPRLYKDNPVPLSLAGPVLGSTETSDPAAARREVDAISDPFRPETVVETAWALDDDDGTQIVAVLTNVSETTLCNVGLSVIGATLVDGSTLEDRDVDSPLDGLRGQSGRSFGSSDALCIASYGSILANWRVDDVDFATVASVEFAGQQSEWSPAGEVVLEETGFEPVSYEANAGGAPSVILANRLDREAGLDTVTMFALDDEGLPLHVRHGDRFPGPFFAPGEERVVSIPGSRFRGSSTRLLVVPTR